MTNETNETNQAKGEMKMKLGQKVKILSITPEGKKLNSLGFFNANYEGGVGGSALIFLRNGVLLKISKKSISANKK